MAASRDNYDGVPYELLPRDSAEVTPVSAEHLRTRRERKESEHEFNIEPEWAVEAALDPAALLGDGGSTSRESVLVIGRSTSAPPLQYGEVGRVLAVYVIPATHPPDGRWFVVTAWTAGRRQWSAYWKEHPDG
ncbi:MAG: hypothetical protein DLM62_03330 [Pseudonocardiales bacterium]|nr:MAG: hypothetical protein DLM62_03330 [Pseudonocardiales bacterium]